MSEPTPSAAAVAVARALKLAMYLEDPCECDEQSICWDHLHIARALDAERAKVWEEAATLVSNIGQRYCDQDANPGPYPGDDTLAVAAFSTGMASMLQLRARAAEVRR